MTSDYFRAKIRLALIPPFELLEYTDQTDMQLMLPHLLSNSETYRYVYQTHCDDADQYVILDNGEAESVHTDPDDLLEIAMTYGVDEVVLPDVIQNGQATRQKADAFFMRQSWHGTNLKFMYVVQGTSMMEFRDEALWANRHPLIDVIGIPRHMIETCRNTAARFHLAEYLYSLNGAEYKPVHLLGGSHLCPTEMRLYKWTHNVRSTDTSSPFNYAFEGRQLRSSVECKRPHDYFNLPWDEFDPDTLDFNVKKLKEWTRG